MPSIPSLASLFGLYAEDKYRASSRLTLTGGVRWDPYLPYVPASNHIDCWNPGQQSQVFTNAPKGLIYPWRPGLQQRRHHVEVHDSAAQIGNSIQTRPER